MRPGLTWSHLALWAALLGYALAALPLLPIDETRYLSVAWEMWQRSDFLVPYLNGHPYAQKPPLLFWLFQLGWGLFGVNDWWPRVAVGLVALAALALTAGLARTLWPGEQAAGRYGAWALLGCLLWAAFVPLVQFDMLLLLCTVLGLTGVLRAWQGQAGGWWLVGAGIGLGVLAKGPVILLHVLPAALLAPWWGGGADNGARTGGWARWYAGLAGAVVLGAAMALAWAVPAALAGGSAYGQAIFWGQTAGRVVDSFAHREPWWWYLPRLPLLVLPWTVWPPVWRGVRRLAPGWSRDAGVRFVLAWLIPVLVAFSAVSGKQVKYLLPALPAIALVAGRGLTTLPPGRLRLRAPGLLLLALGFALAVLPLRAPSHLPDWVAAISPAWGLGLAAAGAGLFLLPAVAPARAVALMAAAGVLLVVVGEAAVLGAAGPAYDLRPLSRVIRHYQAAGRPVANLGTYHGQFQFLGRLEHPIRALAPGQALAWARAHRNGYLVVYYHGGRPAPPTGAVFAQPYRGDSLAVWQARQVLARPAVLPGP